MKKIIILSIIFISFVVVLPTQVSAATSAGVKPNSFFYFFDTASEKVNLFFTFNPEKKAKKALEYASERLAEAETITDIKDSNMVKAVMENYTTNIALASEKSKEVKDQQASENLLSTIADNTSKNQEVLNNVLAKVPEEAKDAILKAIEASKKEQEQATKQIAELKGEVEKLKQEVAELKQEKIEKSNDDEKLKLEAEKAKFEAETAKAKAETEKLKSEVKKLETEKSEKNEVEIKAQTDVEAKNIEQTEVKIKSENVEVDRQPEIKEINYLNVSQCENCNLSGSIASRSASVVIGSYTLASPVSEDINISEITIGIDSNFLKRLNSISLSIETPKRLDDFGKLVPIAGQGGQLVDVKDVKSNTEQFIFNIQEDEQNNFQIPANKNFKINILSNIGSRIEIKDGQCIEPLTIGRDSLDLNNNSCIGGIPYKNATNLQSCKAIGKSTGKIYTCNPQNINGQTITISN